MRLGRIEGKVWATVKDHRLHGLRLQILQPVNEFEQAEGAALIAVDDIGVSEGDLVYWVNSTEAGFLLPDRDIPSEISIVGLVDRLDIGIHAPVEARDGARPQLRSRKSGRSRTSGRTV
jgi:microcompartment protein CcmK/EutM